jgi:hypothetical protein
VPVRFKCPTNSTAMDNQTLRQRLLTAPVLPLILRQALPVIAVLLLQTPVDRPRTGDWFIPDRELPIVGTGKV